MKHFNNKSILLHLSYPKLRDSCHYEISEKCEGKRLSSYEREHTYQISNIEKVATKVTVIKVKKSVANLVNVAQKSHEFHKWVKCHTKAFNVQPFTIHNINISIYAKLVLVTSKM